MKNVLTWSARREGEGEGKKKQRRMVNWLGRFTVIVLMLVITFANTQESTATFLDESFEDNNLLTSWSIDVENAAAGSVTQSGVFTPQDGERFLRLLMTFSGDEDEVRVYQSGEFTAGDTIGGWYGWSSFSPNDGDVDTIARISIHKEGAHVSDNEFILEFGTEVGDDDTSNIPWTSWSHTFQETGNYTLSYWLFNDGQWEGNTIAVFDAAPAAVPEPTTIALLGISLVGLVGAGARKKLKKKEVGTS